MRTRRGSFWLISAIERRKGKRKKGESTGEEKNKTRGGTMGVSMLVKSRRLEMEAIRKKQASLAVLVRRQGGGMEAVVGGEE